MRMLLEMFWLAYASNIAAKRMIGDCMVLRASYFIKFTNVLICVVNKSSIL